MARGFPAPFFVIAKSHLLAQYSDEIRTFDPVAEADIMITDLFVGGALSFLNFGIHAVMTGIIVVATRRTAEATDHLGVFGRLTALLTITMTALMCAHVVEILVWAGYLTAAGVTISKISRFEFAFENYTALGYGDALPAEGRRLLGPIIALNGLLLIGWSVAIIFEVMRMAELQIGREDKDVR